MTNETKPVAWRVKDYADGWTVYQYEHEAHRAARNGNLIEPLYTRAPINRPSPEAGESGLVERLNGMAGTGGRITCMAEYNGGAVASSQSIAAALCADAADEITNLQAELAEARKERDEAASARDGHYELSRHWNREYHRYRKARTQAEAQRDAAWDALRKWKLAVQTDTDPGGAKAEETLRILDFLEAQLAGAVW